MTKVVIHFDDHSTCDVQLSDTAQEAVRFNFNPFVLKALAAAFISVVERYNNHKPRASYEFHTAETNMISASMLAVLAATKDV